MAYNDQWMKIMWQAWSYDFAFTADEIVDLFGQYISKRYESPQMPSIFRGSYPWGITVDKSDPNLVVAFDIVYSGPWAKLQGMSADQVVAKKLGNAYVTSIKWNVRRRDHKAVSKADLDFMRDVFKRITADVRANIPSSAPSGARATMQKYAELDWEANKEELLEYGYTKEDIVPEIPPLVSWSFTYAAAPYAKSFDVWKKGAAAYDVGKPRTPALPPKPVIKPTPGEEPVATAPKKKIPGWAALIAALLAGIAWKRS